MTESSGVSVEAATSALSRLFYGLDSRNNAMAIAAFGDGARWLRQGKELVGLDEIKTALEARPEGSVTLHVLSNVFADDDGAIRFYLTVYRSNVQAEKPAIVSPAVAGMGICWLAQNGNKLQRLETGPYAFVDRT